MAGNIPTTIKDPVIRRFLEDLLKREQELLVQLEELKARIVILEGA